MKNSLTLKKDIVYNKLRESIQDNTLPGGSKLQRETTLATEFGVSRITLRAALDQLEQDGLIERIQGRGTFVSPNAKQLIKKRTVMVLHSSQSGVEQPWHYILPEINRLAGEKKFEAFTTTKEAFELFSDDDIQSFIKKNNVMGVLCILSSFIGNEIIIDKLYAMGIPVILVHGRISDAEKTGFATIAIDIKASWSTAIQYLSELGHRTIGIIGNSESSLRGYSKEETLKLLKKYGISDTPELISCVDFNKRSIEVAVKKILNQSPQPTAFLCISDFYAVYVCDTLKKMNIRIPEDISVMGICGYPDMQLLSTPLTTIDYGYREFASLAFEMLLDPEQWIDMKSGRGKLRVKPFKLKIKKSTVQHK